MKQINKKKGLILVLISVVVLASTLSMHLSAEHEPHECVDEHCELCCLIESVFRQLTAAQTIPTFTGAAVLAVLLLLFKIYSGGQWLTLVGKKIRMDC